MNRSIWMLWLQGWDQAPAVAATARHRFNAMNPGWKIHALDSENFAEFLDAEGQWIRPLVDRIPAAAFSDLLRAELLRIHGGVWADSTLIPLRPLDEWLPVAGSGGFFAFRNPGPDRALSTWFLASEEGHYLIRRWGEEARHYWEHRSETDAYHWFHYLFGELVRKDAEALQAWQLVPDLPASAPHLLLPHRRRLASAPTERDLAYFEGDVAPVLKLSHKFGTTFPTDSNWSALLAAGSETLMHCFPSSSTPSLIGRSFAVSGPNGPRQAFIEAALEAHGATVVTKGRSSEPGTISICPVTGGRTIAIGKGRSPESPLSPGREFCLGIDSGYIQYPEVRSSNCTTTSSLVSVLARSAGPRHQ